MLTKKKLREKNIELTREQIAIRAIEIANLCASGSYKNAIGCIGRMLALSKAINDTYWEEKMMKGNHYESDYLLYNIERTKTQEIE